MAAHRGGNPPPALSHVHRAGDRPGHGEGRSSREDRGHQPHHLRSRTGIPRKTHRVSGDLGAGRHREQSRPSLHPLMASQAHANRHFGGVSKDNLLREQRRQEPLCADRPKAVTERSPAGGRWSSPSDLQRPYEHAAHVRDRQPGEAGLWAATGRQKSSTSPAHASETTKSASCRNFSAIGSAGS